MLVPKRVKHRKVQRGSMKGKAKGGTRLNWRIRHPGARSRLDHQPPDRGSLYRHDPLHEAWRQGVDHDLPDKPITKKPATETRAVGSGEPEGMGRGRQAQPHHVPRSVASTRPSPKEALPPRHQQVAHQVQDCFS